MSTTTTEVSSNPNSSCRLLVCLSSLPFHDQRLFRSLLSHTQFLRLSICCRSLRSSIRHDQILWHELYHRDFLSGAYHVKEMDFVLWCIRMDGNDPCTSDKRADQLENVDWYNTYRRRVSTENNWRFGRCKTTHIDTKSVEFRGWRHEDANENRVFVTRRFRSVKGLGHRYTLEYLPHLNLRSSNNIVHNSTLSTSPNVFLLSSENIGNPKHVLSGRYIAVVPMQIKSYTDYNVKILSRKHGGLFTTFDVPGRYQVKKIEGRWLLLVYEKKGMFYDLPDCIPDIMVFDIDNSVMCLGSTDDTWDATCFYKTTNHTAIVYTARIVKDDDVNYIEWALYQFSTNNPVIQLRSGWFQLPEGMMDVSMRLACNAYDSYMIIELRGHREYNPYIMHSVASSGQSYTPRNCYTISDQHIPTPLLRAGYDHITFSSSPTKVWTDLTYNDNQVLQIPGTTYIRHIIGDIYAFITEHNDIKSRLLVDINTKEIIRKLDAPDIIWGWPNYAMVGMLCCSNSTYMQTMQEYGEL